MPPAPPPQVAAFLRRPLRGPLVLLALTGLMACGALSLALWVLDTVGQAVAAGPGFYQALGRALLLSLPALAFLRFLDRREREQPWVFWSVLAWGAVVATGLALVLGLIGGLLSQTALGLLLGQDPAALAEGGWDQLIQAILLAPLVEEAVKGLALLLLVWLLADEFDNLRDGLIYGALVGLGFNLLESALYVIYDFLETGQLAFGPQLAIRFTFLGLSGHAVYSALLGAALGWARQSRGRGRLLVGLLLGYGGAVAAHFLHNSLGVIVLPALAGGLGGSIDPADGLLQADTFTWWAAAALTALVVNGFAFALLSLALWRSGRHERRLIQAMLAEERELDGRTVTEDDLAAAAGERMLCLRRAKGLPPEAGRALVQAQNELAFRRRRLQLRGADPATDPTAMAWRARILALRGQGPGGAGSAAISVQAQPIAEGALQQAQDEGQQQGREEGA